MIFVWLLIILFLLSPKGVLAISSPNLISPSNQSTTSSSSLNWAAVDGSIQYKVIVDDEPTTSSPYAKDPYYTTNTKYTPQLSPSNYFWKVAAKDSSGSWSWSEIWSFTLISSNSSPSNLSPSPNPSIGSGEATFTISDIPSSISSSQSFLASVELNLPNSPNSTFYLKGAFKKADSSNYFGLTKVGSSWIKNSSSYSSQKSITTDSTGKWSGSLEVMPDDTDSGFTGTDNYIFKVARYSDSGSGPTWSNEVTIHITGTATTKSTTSSKSTTSKSSPKSSSIPYLPSNSLSKSIVKMPTKISSHTASVAGVETLATPSAEALPITEVKSEHQINFIPYLGGALIFAGLGSLIYITLKQRYNSR